MKQNIILAFIILTIASTSSFSQTLQGGTFEGSFSGAYGSVSLVGNVTSPFVQVSLRGRPVRYFSSFIRAGYFITRAIEGEVELHWLTMSSISPIGIYSFNVSWNIPIRESRFLPFFLFGGGIATGMPPLLVGTTPGDGPDCSVVNLGVGLKYLLAEHVALRTEYRFQQLSTVQTARWNSSTFVSTMTANHESFLFGFSVLF